MRSIVLIAHNLRSAHNVGSLFRTSEGLGVQKLFLTGYTPYPMQTPDERLPHLARKIEARIDKTALGSIPLLPWEHHEDIFKVLDELHNQGYLICAVEQTDTATQLPDFQPPEKIVLLVGREVEGVEPDVLIKCDATVEIPMFGKKESYNVVQAAAIALYHCRFAKG